MSIIAGMLNQTVDVVYSVSVDGAGDTSRTVVYRDVKCRWQERIKQAFLPTGEPVTTKIEMWILPEYTIDRDCEIEKASVLYRVVDIEKRYDINGNLDHRKVYLE